ncbi:class I SAM-dependent methyltransferase [Acidobacteriota bacterium]
MSQKDKGEFTKLFGQPKTVIESELPEREVVCCPLCDLVPQVFAIDYQGFYLARCSRCKLEFHSPRPRFDQLSEKIYAREYHTAEKDAGPGTHRLTHFTRQIQRLKQLVGSSGSILDVGCGDGSFLLFAKESGWQVAGTDIYLSPAAEAIGIPLWAGRLEDIDFGQQHFDVIRFHHVLEHTQNPLVDLRQARKLLKQNGVLILSVPNLAGISPRLKSWQSRLRMKGRRWRHYAALHHFWFFTPPTLQLLVEAAQFTVVHWDTPVIAKGSTFPLVNKPMQFFLESFRLGSILDFYCRPV